jgi:hypothetical protein
MVDKWIKYILGSLFIFIAPIKPLLFIVGFIVVLDTIFGILRSRKLKIKFTSRRFYSFFKKSLVYQLLIITTFVIDKNLINEFMNMIVVMEFLSTKIVTAAICFNELTSINENVKITYGINIVSYIKKLFKFTKQVKDGLNEFKGDVIIDVVSDESDTKDII